MSRLPTRGDSRQRLIKLLKEANAGRIEGLDELLGSNDQAHATVVRMLTQLEYEPSEAREHWKALRRHRDELSRRLGRLASIQVAALDYFQNLKPELRNPTVVEMSTFLATEKNAITDGLTGLYNRQFFDASLRRELKRARRYGLAFSLVMLDLDDFKSINDVFGHVVGDEVLTRCSGIIRASVREIDVACRYGGEEFALILPGTSRTGAFIVSERIRVDVKELFDRKPVGRTHLSLSVSGGIAIYPADASSSEGLVGMADRALYRSKREGKDQITLHAEEKRRSPRLDARKVLVFRERRRPDPQEALQSETRNLSRNGALVESRVPLHVGTELEINIHLPRHHSSFFLKGQVVRLEESSERPDSAARYQLGVAFIADTEEDLRQLETLASELYRVPELSEPREEDIDRTG